MQRRGASKQISTTYLYISVCKLIKCINVCDTESLVGYFRFKIKLSKECQTSVGADITVYISYILTATAFHFPLGRISTPTAATYNLYTSHLECEHQTVLPPIFTLGFLGLSLRPVETAPKQLVLQTQLDEFNQTQEMIALRVPVLRCFSKSNISERLSVCWLIFIGAYTTLTLQLWAKYFACPVKHQKRNTIRMQESEGGF